MATTRVDMGSGGAAVASSVIETFPSSTASVIQPLQPAKPSAPQISSGKQAS